MKHIIATMLAIAVLLSPAKAEDQPAAPAETRFVVSRITPDGIVALRFKKVPTGGGNGMGGYVGSTWASANELVLVKNFSREKNIAEGEKFTILAVPGNVQKIVIDNEEHTLRVYRSCEASSP